MSTTHDEVGKGYLPGMGHSWLLPLYDPLQWLLGVSSAQRALVDQADVRPGQRVLEIGCGTGNVVIRVKRRQQRAAVVGLDPDAAALARARRKARRKALELQFDTGFAEQLPYPDASFDTVLSAFMLHHLEPDERPQALREVRRVLVPGGSLHLLDLGGARQPSDGFVACRAHRSRRLEDNFGERIPSLMRDAGLVAPREVSHDVRWAMGRITYYHAVAPDGSDASPRATPPAQDR